MITKISESGRLRFLAFVSGSKQVVISTGRALSRVVMGSSLSAQSSPENIHDNIESLADRLNHLIDQDPWRMSDMLKIIGLVCYPYMDMFTYFLYIADLIA